MAAVSAPFPTLPQVPSTALGDLARASRRTTSRERVAKRAGQVIRVVLVAAVVMVASLAIFSTQAHAWLGDDTVSKIQNFCQPEDVTVPSTSFSGLDSMFGLNEFDSSNVAGQATVLPDAKGAYADGSAIEASYYRYGFSGLSLHAYGTGCGDLIARYAPSMYNIVLTMFVYLPVAFTMLIIKMALGTTLGSFMAVLMNPTIHAFGVVMKPIVGLLAPVGTLVAFIKWRGRLGKVLGVAAYALACGGFVWWSVSANDPMGTLAKTADAIVVDSTSIVTEAFASTTFPQVAANGTDVSTTDGVTISGGPIGAINNSLWKGIPLATWATAQMGSDMAYKAQNGDGNAKAWMHRLLNANHVGVKNADGDVDDNGLLMLAGVDAWNNRSYALTGHDSKVDAWTTGFDKDVDGPSFTTNNAVWAKVPQLADVGMMCGASWDVESGDGSSDADKNRWMFNGSCAPSAADAAWKGYYTGARWAESASALLSGAIGAVIVVSLLGLVGLYISIQKALMYWLLMFAPIFIGIAAFGDEKRRRFASAYAGAFFANVMKQVSAVAGLVLLSYIIAAIITSPHIFFFLKPLMIFILGQSLLLLFFIARRIAKAAIAGDTSIVQKAAGAPVKAAKVAAATAAVAATGGAALGAVGAASAGGGGSALALGNMARGAKIAAGAGRTLVAGQGGAAGLARNILSNPTARNKVATVMGRGKVGTTARRVFAASDLLANAATGTSKGQQARMANDPIARAASTVFGNGQNPVGDPKTNPTGTPTGNPATGTPVNGKDKGKGVPGTPGNPLNDPNARPGTGTPATTGGSNMPGTNTPTTGRHTAPTTQTGASTPGAPVAQMGEAAGKGVGAPTPTADGATASTPNGATPATTGNVPTPTGTVGEALSQPATTNPQVAAASAQTATVPPVGGAVPGTAVGPDAVQTPLNQERTAATASEVVTQHANAVVANSPEGVTREQAIQTVQAQMAGTSSQVVSGLPTTVQMDPQALSPEQARIAVQIAGGDAANLPAAVATVVTAQEGMTRLADLGSSSAFGGPLQTEVVGNVRSGVDVEALVGMTSTQALSDPAAFVERAVTSDVYGSGTSLAGMDPRHAATAPLYAAVGAMNSGDEVGYANALGALQDAIEAHGLPSVASNLHAVDGSAMAEASAQTLAQAAAMAATYRPGNPAEWGDMANSIAMMRSTLSEEAQATPAGMALSNLSAIVTDPSSTVDDIRVAGATMVSAFNMDSMHGETLASGLDYQGANLSGGREGDVFNADDFVRAFANSGVLEGTALAAAAATSPATITQAPLDTGTPVTEAPASTAAAAAGLGTGFADLARQAAAANRDAAAELRDANAELQEALDDMPDSHPDVTGDASDVIEEAKRQARARTEASRIEAEADAEAAAEAERRREEAERLREQQSWSGGFGAFGGGDDYGLGQGPDQQ